MTIIDICIPCEGFQKPSVHSSLPRVFSSPLEGSWSRHKGCENPALEMCFIRMKQNLIRAGWKSFFLCKSSFRAKQIFHQNGKIIRNFKNEVDAVVWNVFFKKKNAPLGALKWCGRLFIRMSTEHFFPENCSRNGAFPGVVGWWMDVLYENHWKFGDKFKLETSSAGTAVDQFTLVLSTQQPPVT